MGTLTVCGWLEKSEVKSTIHPRLKDIWCYHFTLGCLFQSSPRTAKEFHCFAGITLERGSLLFSVSSLYWEVYVSKTPLWLVTVYEPSACPLTMDWGAVQKCIDDSNFFKTTWKLVFTSAFRTACEAKKLKMMLLIN